MSELPRATQVLSPGTWHSESAADRLVLPYEARHRRRMRYIAEGGTTFLLDLHRAVLLRAGDGLQLEDGRIIAVGAAREALLKVTAPDSVTMMRLAWHLGNRHLPSQLCSDHLLIQYDPVIAAMLQGLGATIEQVHEPFTPESGAYGSAQGHHHALAPSTRVSGDLEAVDWHEPG
jgi:urease accessory protein